MNSDIYKIKKIVNQAEIARRIGISKSYVNQIILGVKKSPKYEREIKKVINELISK